MKKKKLYKTNGEIVFLSSNKIAEKNVPSMTGSEIEISIHRKNEDKKHSILRAKADCYFPNTLP